MAYPQDFVRVTFGGHLFGDKEIWSNSINFMTAGGDFDYSVNKLNSIAAGLASDIQSWFQNTKTLISKAATLEWIKVAAIDRQGHYRGDAGVFDFSTFPKGGQNGVCAPQLTVAVSFESARRRKPGKNARIYPPMNAMAVDEDGMLPMDRAQDMADVTQVLINALNYQTTQGFGVRTQAIVASQMTQEHNPIVRVRVGRVFDTQRSRRNRLDENYQASADLNVSTT